MNALLAVAVSWALSGLSYPSHAPKPADCDAPPPAGPRGLPWRVELHTSCGRFVVAPSGRVARAAEPDETPSWVPTNAWRADGVAAGTWISRRGGGIAVLRDGREIWRTRVGARYTDGIAVGARHIAFSVYDDGLYVAPLDGRERRVAAAGRSREHPLGWSRRDLLFTSVWPELRVRRADGSLFDVVARRVRAMRYDATTGGVYYVVRSGRVEWTDGIRTRVVGAVDRVVPGSWIEPLPGGLVAITGSRISVLDARGELFATAWYPPRKRPPWQYVQGGVVGRRDARAVAFVTNFRGTDFGDVIETVNVLRPGDTRPTPVHQTVVPLSCGGGGEIAWRGRWLLYSNRIAQTAVAIDTETHRRIDLTPLVRRVPGKRYDVRLTLFVARWA